jgi:hypothetical protein
MYTWMVAICVMLLDIDIFQQSFGNQLKNESLKCSENCWKIQGGEKEYRGVIERVWLTKVEFICR